MVELEELRTCLQDIVGLEAVHSDSASLACYAVDGMLPAVMVQPEEPQQVAAVLATAAKFRAPVVPWGGGTRMARGHRPTHYFIALSLERLNRIVDFDVPNLTVTIQAGLTIAKLQATLAAEGQFLPLDPPIPTRATVGGIVAANINGPSRLYYGAVRDLTLGLSVALSNGEIIRAGGKTMKNVAGYDMAKLFIGSYGTLGIITEATFRLLPLPAEKRALQIGFGRLDQAFSLATRILDSVLQPAALTILNAHAVAQVLPGRAWPAALVVLINGSPETVARQVHDIRDMAGAAEVETASDATLQTLHAAIRDFLPNAAAHPRTALMATMNVPLSTPRDFVETAEKILNAGGFCAAHCIDPGIGTIHIAVEGVASEKLIGAYEQLVDAADAVGGTCVLDWIADPALKNSMRVWGRARPDWQLNRALKTKFDPHGILNLGRFVDRL